MTSGVLATAAPIGYWTSNGTPPSLEESALKATAEKLGEPLVVVKANGGFAIAKGGHGVLGGAAPAGALPIAAYVAPLRIDDLGDASFRADHRLKYAYVAGAMANGIASTDIVEAMGQAGMLGFFGAAGLSPQRIEAAIDRVTGTLGDRHAFGFNLIHNPAEPASEAAVVDLYIRRNIRLVEASAYLDLSLPVIRYRVHGIHRDPSGRIVAPNKIIAKISRVEVATRFLSPPPERRLAQLVQMGEITPEQAELAQHIPMAQDITAEADSGGHTDNRPAITLLPTIIALRDRLQAQFKYDAPLRVGLAGGIATPYSAAAAFAMGAAFVVGGSIHQACAESGTSDAVREMLAQAQQADVAMAPAADMFEMGVKVQVLKRGTMFPMRAHKLYDVYRAYGSIEEIPTEERTQLEKNFFRASLDDIWSQTREFFTTRDPSQIARAESDAKHKMALVFRWYLGHSSRWANAGEPSRKIDYQVWCGPAMGSFNEWTQGTFLAEAKNRRIVTVAFNMLYSAAVLLRLNALRCQGVPVPARLFQLPPLPMDELRARLGI